MKLIFRLLNDFFGEEKWNTTAMIGTSFVTNIIQTNGISYLTANIISTIQKKSHTETVFYFKTFIFLAVIYVIMFYIYRLFQNKILTKLRQWIRYQMIRIMMLVNNEDFSGVNFSKFGSPINRLSSVCFMVFTDVITYVLPNIIFLLVIGAYLMYTNVKVGLFFLLCNASLFYYISTQWSVMKKKNDVYEEKVNHIESYLLEILNSLDKIISRGQVNYELEMFQEKRDQSVQSAYDFYSCTNYHLLISNGLILAITVLIIGYFMYMYFSKTISLTLFITFFNVMLIYRDRLSGAVGQIPDFIEFFGRAESVLEMFEKMNEDYSNLDAINAKKYVNVKLPFHVIELRDVSFRYKGTEKFLFEHFSLTLHTDNHKIIGITGLSGNGKSTYMKMVLKMHPCNNGSIFIDNHNIEELDPTYIRSNITYVNQTSKLFDKKIIENIMYGCSHEDTCKAHFDEIMKYPKIKDLYRNVDIMNTYTGALGEKLSGGQRQIVNLIGGMINPSKILILDEPTNALDPGLKKEVIGLIRDFKKYKQCIIIITHDQDVHSLFDESYSV